MITAEGLMQLGFTPEVDFSLQDNGDGVVYIKEWLSSETQPTEEAIEAAHTQWQADYDSKEYARLRKKKYDQLNQYEMMFDDQVNGTTTWVDAINAIKAEYPKPE